MMSTKRRSWEKQAMCIITKIGDVPELSLIFDAKSKMIDGVRSYSPGWPFTWMLECTLIDTRSTLQLGCWQLCQLELCLNVPHCFLFAFSKCLESFLIADIHIHERNIGIVYTPLWRKNKETVMSINCEKIRWQIGNKKLYWPSGSDHNGGCGQWAPIWK